MKLKLVDLQLNEVTGGVDLSEAVFGARFNSDLVAQVYQVYMTNQRVSSAAPKTRAQVRGGGRKPWAQKGTGRARAGSIRSPLFRGGGVVFGPAGRVWKSKVNKKMKKSAIRSVLSKHFADGTLLAVVVTDDGDKTAPLAKAVRKFVEKIRGDKHIEGRLVTFVTDSADVRLGLRNMQNLNVTSSDGVNIYDVLAPAILIFDKEALVKINEKLA